MRADSLIKSIDAKRHVVSSDWRVDFFTSANSYEPSCIFLRIVSDAIR